MGSGMRYGGHGMERNGQSGTQMERRAERGKVWGWRQERWRGEKVTEKGWFHTDCFFSCVFWLRSAGLAHLSGRRFLHIIQGWITSAWFIKEKKKSKWILRFFFKSIIALNCWSCFRASGQSYRSWPSVCGCTEMISSPPHSWVRRSDVARRGHKTAGLIIPGHWERSWRAPHLSTAAGY